MERSDFLYLKSFEPSRWPAGNPETGYMNVDGSPTKTEVLKARHNIDTSHFWQLSFGKRPSEEMYNIKNDPDCVFDLADKEEYQSLKLKLEKEMTIRLIYQDDPRMLERGYIFDQYPDVSPSKQFYNRMKAGIKVPYGWINSTDFEPQASGLEVPFELEK